MVTRKEKKALDRQSILIRKHEIRIIQQTHQTQFSIAEVEIPEKDYIYFMTCSLKPKQNT